MDSFNVGREKCGAFAVDTQLLAAIVLLAGCGLAMFFSVSYSDAIYAGTSVWSCIRNQLIAFAGGTLFAFLIAVCRPMDFLKSGKNRPTKIMFCAILINALAISTLPWACTVNGASRWIAIPGLFTVQPSEFFKIALVIFLADSFVRMEKGGGKFEFGISLFFTAAITAIVLGFQSDLFTAAFLIGLYLAMLMASKVNVRTKLLWFFLILFVAALVVVISVIRTPFRLDRVSLNGSTYQQMKASQALAAGRFWGRGIGCGNFKWSLPEAKSDFIFSIVGEELGFAGIALIILLFVFFACRGYRIARNAEDGFSSYMAFGFTTSILFQMLANAAVATGLVPTTGVPMPFFSQGGTSMFVTMIMCGFLLNISRNSSVGGNYEQH